MTAEICGFPIENVSMSDAVERVLDLQRSRTPRHVSFVNAHYVNVAETDFEYDAALRSADVLFADGSGMRLAGRMRREELVDNVNGTDMLPVLARAMARAGRSVYLLGGRPGVADGVRAWLAEHAPGLTVVGVSHGYHTQAGWASVVCRIRDARPDLLLVAMGAPAQDVWIRRRLPELDVPVTMAVGGLFDFYSGRIPRAPRLMRTLGIEWVFRLLQEPSRMWRRYLVGNVVFVLREALWTLLPSPTGMES